ncbi:MAG: heme biosynthesis protein HemY [Magnetovibrio sp.]|nr:heme biosynthesis protein HemY [Magnetovibrio sp.]
MVRLIFFLCALVAVAWAGVWVVDHPGRVALNWGGWQVEMSAGVMALGIILVAIISAITYRFWLFITRAPGRIGHLLQDRRSQKGYKALTKGMVAVAAGDAAEAQNQVKKADGLLREPPLTLLLRAQSAQLNGDENAAETFFKTMLDDPEMEFLGVRGLLNQALKRGDESDALALARRAQVLKPKSAWTADILFELEARGGHWDKASVALTQMHRLTPVTMGESQHVRAVALLGQSLEAETSGDDQGALKFAKKAVRENGKLIPAALRLARLYLKEGQIRKATNVIEKAWVTSPHPDLAALYLDANEPSDGLKQFSRAEKLLVLHPGSTDGHIALAKVALEAQLWGQARTHLQAAIDSGRTTRTVYTLMARLEDEDRGDKELVRSWLTRAAAAAADPAWVCGECGHVETEWKPHCPKCKSFGGFKWETPPGYEALSTLNAEPLRLEAQNP